jgi:hypothetical protein
MTDLAIKEIVIKELEKAESIWKDVKGDILEKANRTFSAMNENYTPSVIPGFPLLKNGEGKVGKFIAMVLDIRDSSNHLLQAISNNRGVSQLERVFYETTAINTIGLIAVNKNSGTITEFLGDGFLAIFSAENKSDVQKPKKAAEECLRVVKELINPLLKERYDLPALTIGIGLAYSKAIVTVIGFDKDLFPKAIGECVFRASKLSNGNNEILYDDAIKNFWPSSQGGTISFSERNHKNSSLTKGFILNRKNG